MPAHSRILQVCPFHKQNSFEILPANEASFKCSVPPAALQSQRGNWEGRFSFHSPLELYKRAGNRGSTLERVLLLHSKVSLIVLFFRLTAAVVLK
jgi:hypothetical protein